jgi:hypothetical protein
VLRQTAMDALLPRPAPIGMVERKVYTHGGDFLDARERKRYRNDKAEAWCILRVDSGMFGETVLMWGFSAARRSGSNDVTRS